MARKHTACQAIFLFYQNNVTVVLQFLDGIVYLNKARNNKRGDTRCPIYNISLYDMSSVVSKLLFGWGMIRIASRSPANKSQDLKWKKTRKFCKTEKGHTKTGWRGITSPAWMKLSVGLALRGILSRVKRLKTLFHACIVNAQELVL